MDIALESLRSKLTPDAMEQISSVYAFYFKDLGETHTLDAHGRDGRGWLMSSPEANQLTPNFVVTISSDDFAHLVAGRREVVFNGGSVGCRHILRVTLVEGYR